MNRWKTLALIMIGLLAIAVGFRFTYFEGHSFPVNEDEKLFAINAVQKGLGDENGINNYNITVPERGRIISTVNGDKKVLHVFLIRENITLIALVDMETGKVVEKSRIESSGWMAEYIKNRNNNLKSWGYQRIFNR
ncbi:MAG: hypothetical protein C3F06_07040 [Candidatus Methanoperedenaceae archaeon]|nr:MAG: hypothetical protein C3F06_07040 [Candidatus Methanoperedenaceae archaeon]